MLTVPTYVSGQTAEIVKQTEKIKQEVVALPAESRVRVKLRDDKNKLTGHINYAGDDFFMITDVKTKGALKVAYSNVVQIERKEDPGFPKKGKIALGVLGVLLVMGMIANGGWMKFSRFTLLSRPIHRRAFQVAAWRLSGRRPLVRF